MWKIELPLKVDVSKKSSFSLNLNQYRNAHYHVLNTAKVNYSELVKKRIAHIPQLKACTLKYVLYLPTNRRVDISNVCSVIDKFFCDAFVEAGKLKDDSYDFLKEVTYCFGGIDKANPRVEVLIEPAQSSEEDMQITITQTEIELAITDYIKSQINVRDGMEIKIDIKATRGDQGMTAMIDIVPANTAVVQPAAATTNKARTVVTKDEPKEDVKDAPVELPDDANDNGPAPEPEVEKTEPKPEKEVKRSGLFADLKKPENK